MEMKNLLTSTMLSFFCSFFFTTFDYLQGKSLGVLFYERDMLIDIYLSHFIYKTRFFN